MEWSSVLDCQHSKRGSRWAVVGPSIGVGEVSLMSRLGGLALERAEI